MAGARSELKTLNAPIVGEVGDIINGYSTSPSGGITIFHSLGKLLGMFALDYVNIFFNLQFK